MKIRNLFERNMSELAIENIELQEKLDDTQEQLMKLVVKLNCPYRSELAFYIDPPVSEIKQQPKPVEKHDLEYYEKKLSEFPEITI